MTKSGSWPPNFVNFKNFEISQIGSFWHQIWRDRPKLSPKNLFWCWWRRRCRHGETFEHCPLYSCLFYSVKIVSYGARYQKQMLCTMKCPLRDQDISYVSCKCQRNRLSSCWDTALWIWLAGVVCSAQRGLLTHWTCVLTPIHKNRSHG